MKRVVMMLACLLYPAYFRAMGSVASDDDSGCEYALSSTDSDKGDEVADMIFGKPGKDARKYEVNALVDAHLLSEALTHEQRRQIKDHLKSLSDNEYLSVIGKMDIVRGKRGKKASAKKIDVATALLAIVDELKVQNQFMESSGEVQKQAYEQQVASAEFERHKWKNRFWGVIGAALLTNGVQFAINMYQVTDESSC